MPRHSTGDLTGRCVLIVEDEYIIAQDLVEEFKSRGAEIIGPAPTVERALNFIEHSKRLDGAVLDINLRGEKSFPIADVLRERGIPFVFSTGYDIAAIPEQYRIVPLYEKPRSTAAIADVLSQQIAPLSRQERDG